MGPDRRAVLVLTRDFDPTADMVMRELNARGAWVFRCDAADFPTRLTLSATLGPRWSGILRDAHRELPLEKAGSVYYRRPTRFTFPDSIPAAARPFAQAEARLGFGGVIASLPCFWLNHPARIADAEYKPFQLQAAADAGLRVPKTLITNDPAVASRFAESLDGRVVYKALSFAWVAEQDTAASVYTTLVPAESCADPNIALTAHLFQEWVPKSHDVRLTVIDDEFFAVEIHVEESGARVDWRLDYGSHRYRICEVPDDVRSRVCTMLHRLGLHFGAFDFAVTSEGEWAFLEVNPNGQWGWIELATGLRISAAIAEALTREHEA